MICLTLNHFAPLWAKWFKVIKGDQVINVEKMCLSET